MADIKEKKRSSKSSGAPKKTAIKKQAVAQEAGNEVIPVFVNAVYSLFNQCIV